MRPLLAILAVLALPAPGHPGSHRFPSEVSADSLYDAGAIDSLYAFSNRHIARAHSRGDSVLLGRMTYHRGRARLALRDPGATDDLDRALAIAVAIDDSAGRMNALGLQAFVAVNEGRFEESIALNDARIDLARALGRRGSEGWGHQLIGYSELYRENNQRARAEYEEAWRAFADAGRPREQLSASIGLARALEKLGRPDQARTSYQRAWLVARELGDRSQEADAVNNLGNLELEHGDLALAAEYYDRAFHIKRELKSFDIANAARNVALVDGMIGRYAHAESTLVEAMELSTRGMLDVPMVVELGRLRMARGRYEAAAPCFREVLRGSSVTKSRIEGATFLALSLAALDSVPAAVALLDRELRMLPTAAPSVWRCEALLAWSGCLRAAGDVDRARVEAGEAWDDATARNDSTLLVLAASEASLCARARGDLDAASRWFERARGAFDAARRVSAFQWREARRTELATALIEAGDVLRVHPAGVSAAERARRHFDFLQEVAARTLSERVSDPRRVEGVDAAVLRPVTSVEMQASVLRAGECLVAAHAGAGCIYLFAVTPDEFQARVIDDPRGATTGRFSNYARLAARAPSSTVPATIDAAASSLGELLFGELAASVRDAHTLYAALDAPLAVIPFETLVCPGETGPLIASRDVVRVPSAAFLRYLRTHGTPAPSVSTILAVAPGAPALEGARREVGHLARRYGALAAIDPAREDLLANLGRVDVVHVASHVHVDAERPWHSGIQVRTAAETGAHATGSVVAASPLSLTPSDSIRIHAGLPTDEYLRASEIASRHVASRMVVLSGCESALGRAALAEGVLGIGSSFLAAGARTVVASLWEVDDRTTADLMERYYHELAGGAAASTALRSAQLAVRERRPEPFYWAGFVVIGDGGVTVALRPRGPAAPGPVVAVIGLSAFLTAGWFVWRRRTRQGRMRA